MNYDRFQVAEYCFRFGFASFFIAGGVFLGATPRGMRPNGVGEAWVISAVFVIIAIILFCAGHYLQR